jgi:phosphate transport system substrate-binding protein
VTACYGCSKGRRADEQPVSYRKGITLKGLAFQRRKLLSLSVAALAIGASAGFTASASADTTSLTGAGSTLVAPLEAEWASAFASKTGISVNYNAVGSGTGIADISQGTVDFGASDAPLSTTQAAGCHNCIQIPWALSATGVGYNVAGVGHKLRLTGPVLANIYLGNITNWSAPQIKSLNPGVHLPNLKITPVFRSDGSGDTYAFTDYLSHVSSGWASKVGPAATSVSFPAGVSGKGNSGVTADLEATNGSIAYIAVSYLIAHHLPAVAIKNAAGKYEYPNLSNIENAAAVVKHVPANNAMHIVNPPKNAKIAYPISTFTYVIAPTTAPNGAALKQFIRYALGAGQSFGQNLDFAPLPKVVKNAAKASVNRL